MPSKRDKCFKKAIDTLKAQGHCKMDIECELMWSKSIDGKWTSVKNRFEAYQARKSKDVYPGKPEHFRVPDVTVNKGIGKEYVIENKFDGDTWNRDTTKTGKGQQGDYADMNAQSGNPKATKLHSGAEDKELEGNCNCAKNP